MSIDIDKFTQILKINLVNYKHVSYLMQNFIYLYFQFQLNPNLRNSVHFTRVSKTTSKSIFAIVKSPSIERK